MSTLTVTPAAVEIISEIFSEKNLGCHITSLLNAEEALQKSAYEEESWTRDYMFRYAYELRLLREKYEQLEKLLGYEPSRD